jgi:hypothetical protein
LPRDVSLEVESSSHGTTGQNRTGKPEGVAVSSDHATECGVAGLHDVDRPGSRGDGNAKAKQKATAHELVNAGVVDRGASDDGTHDDEEASNEHADSPSPRIDTGADKGESCDTADLVHGGDKASPNTVVGAMEESEEGLVGSETAKQRTVEAIHGLAEEAQKGAKKEEERSGIHDAWPLRNEGFIVGSAALDDFDLCHLGLRFSNQIRLGARRSDQMILTWLEGGLFSIASTPMAPWDFSSYAMLRCACGGSSEERCSLDGCPGYGRGEGSRVKEDVKTWRVEVCLILDPRVGSDVSLCFHPGLVDAS